MRLRDAVPGRSGTDDPTPGRFAAAVAVLASVLSAAIGALGPRAVLAGAVGVLCTGWGVYRGSRVAVTAGGLCLFATAILAAAADGSARIVLGTGATAVLAWTVAQTAVDLRASLGSATTGDLERAHVAGTTGLVGAGSVAIYAVSLVDLGRLPPVAVALVVAGGIALTAALRA